MFTSNAYVLDETPARMGYLNPVDDAERTDRTALWGRLRRDGYLYLPGHLDADLVCNFREYYFGRLLSTGLLAPGSDPRVGIASTDSPGHAQIRRILFDEVVPSREYEELTTQPAIRDWFAWFLDDTVHLHKRKILRHIAPGQAGIGSATQAHYDLIYLREGSARVLSMWIPLGDCPVGMGGLTYLEGSHHWAMAEERNGTMKRPAASITADLPALAEQHESRWLLANYRAGDVVVHSAHIVHAATDNVDPLGRLRLSTDIRYQRVSDPIDWRWQQHWQEYDGL